MEFVLDVLAVWGIVWTAISIRTIAGLVRTIEAQRKAHSELQGRSRDGAAR